MERELQLDDIQGNILAGFNTDFQELVGLTVSQTRDFLLAAKWLAAQADALTVVSEIRAQRSAMRSLQPNTGATWLSIAISHRLLKVTQPDVLIRDDAFNGGMLKRAPSVLGDMTDPSNWHVGSSSNPLDVLLIIAANDEKAVVRRATSLIESASATGLVKTYRETAKRLNDREHFGFLDGISQPKVKGIDRDGTLGAGHFVFGYPRQVGEDPFRPVIDPRNVTDNGSLLVFRRLKQDVRLFRKACSDEATRIAPLWPGITSDHLSALIVGRWPSGAPIKASETEDPGGVPPQNDFDFQNDPDAHSCPFGAHIRKVNPRNGQKDVVEIPRILRRGIPFGPPFDLAPDVEDRGLAFLAFQTSIRSQFEFISGNWMNSRINPGPGNDLLVGRPAGIPTMTVAGPNGPIGISAPSTQWVIPTGGGYLFAPSRSGLAKFGDPPSPLGFWKAKQVFAEISDTLKSLVSK
jgi:Dyp-type peroxidase family